MFSLVQGLHLLSVVIAVGGAITLRFVVMPYLSGEENSVHRQAILSRWRLVLWLAIILIIVSGLGNAQQAYMRVERDFFYWGIFAVKSVLALALFTISIMLTMPMKAFDTFRNRWNHWMHLVVAIGTIILFLSAWLRTFPKPISGS